MSAKGKFIAAAGAFVVFAGFSGQHGHHHGGLLAVLDSVAAAPVGVTSSGPVTHGPLVSEAYAMAARYGWHGHQDRCLNLLWTRESGWRMVWNYQGSGAYGIPQALPASKMASAGADYMNNPATQIRWGLGYIRDTYRDPCTAWSHEEAVSWY